MLRMPAQPLEQVPRSLRISFALRKMPCAVDEPPLVGPREKRLLAFAGLRRVDGVECTVQRKRGHVLRRRRFKTPLQLGVAWVGRSMVPPHTVRVDDDVGPIRIVE
jgi:hypothetical protein